MRIQIAARSCEITDALRDRAERLMERLTKYHVRVTAADVVFSEEKRTRRVEVVLSVDGAPPIVARAEADDHRTALDRVVDKAGRLLRKHRAASKDHQAPPLSEGVAGVAE